MKKWFVLFILSICVHSIWANKGAPQINAKSKLLLQLSKLDPNDTTRLIIYSKLMNISKDSLVEVYYGNKLISEAKRLNKPEYQCKVYLRRITTAYNQYNVAQVNRWMELLEMISKKEKLYNYYFLGRRCVIDMMMVKGEYEREIKEANIMLQEAQKLNNNIGIIAAYQCLANVYRKIYRTKEAAEILEIAYKIAYTTSASFTKEINNSLISTYEALDDYENWFKWIQNFDKYLQKRINTKKESASGLQNWVLMVAIAYINYYTLTGDTLNASKYIQQAEALNMDSINIYCYYHHIARYNYFNEAKLYEQALKETDILANIYKELSPLTYSTMIFMKANILEKLDRDNESLSMYKQAFNISDSVNIAFLNKQTEQLKKDYDADQLLLEKEKINRNIQLLYVGLVLLVILILLIFAIHTFKTQKKLKKSEEEMRKMADDMELANVAKENFLSTISTEISPSLNSVVNGALQLTTDEVTDENERKVISQNLNQTSAELMALINKILNLSRLEAGMMKFKIEDVEIIPFIQGLVNLEKSGGKNIKTDIPDTITDIVVKADVSWVQVIFKNVFSASNGESILLNVNTNENMKEITFKISNSILSADENQTRDIIMTNEINRLAVIGFKGYYQLNVDAQTIIFSFPYHLKH